jgi:hypothetical protein
MAENGRGEAPVEVLLAQQPHHRADDLTAER